MDTGKVPVKKQIRKKSPVKPLMINLAKKCNDTGKGNPAMTAQQQICNVEPPSYQNPKIHVVIEKLLPYLRKKDLFACRLVSKVWNFNVIARFRKEFEIFLCTERHLDFPPRGMKEFPDGCKHGRDRSLETFVKLMRNSFCIPFTMFRLDLNTKGSCRNQFFKVCGPGMTHITLENSSLELYKGMRSVIKDANKDDLCFLIENLNELFKFSKRLEFLEFNTPIILSKNTRNKMVSGLEDKQMLECLKTVSFKGFQGSRKNIPTFFEKFFALTPSIVDVSLTHNLDWGNDSQTDAELEAMWPATTKAMFDAIVSTGRLSTIERLTIHYNIPNDFVDQMQKVGSKLKKLCVTCYPDQLTVIHRLIELQKDTLHSLTYKMYVYAGSGFGNLEFTRMMNLKVLHIHLDHVPIVCTELTFCEKFPNLEVMTCYNGQRVLDLNFLGYQPCPRLKSVDLHFFELDVTGFDNMTQVYSASSLTSLKLDTGRFKNPEILRLIWSNLTNLRVLELSFTMRTFPGGLDHLFTGISVEDCTRIKKDPKYWSFMKGKDKRNKLSDLGQQIRVSPSITNLKNLYRLNLKLPGTGLTDITGYFGLYELDHIRHVHIDFCQFTKPCCEALKKKLNLESAVFREKKGSNTDSNYDRHNLGPFGSGVCIPGLVTKTKDIIPPEFYPFKEKERHPQF